MARIFGTTIPDNKKILYSLPYLYGIGLKTSEIILKTTGVDGAKLAKDLTPEELNKIQKVIEQHYKIEGDLRKEVGNNQKHYKETGSYHGLRLSRRLPLHGRSKTNSRTTRGNVRKTMGSGRKTSDQKT